MDAVALTSVIVSGVLGAGGIAYAAWNSMREREYRRDADAAAREHEREVARTSRVQERRVEPYVDLVEMSQREMLGIERTYPTLGPQPDPPERLSDDEYLRLEARAAALGSTELVEAFRKFKDGARLFYINAGIYGDLKQSGHFDEEITTKMLASREEARARLGELEAQVRDELASL
jgi:hypothetical protein